MIWSKLKSLVDDIGCLLFLAEVIEVTSKTPVQGHRILEQIWRVTVQSASTTAMVGFCCAVMTVQFTMQVKRIWCP